MHNKLEQTCYPLSYFFFFFHRNINDILVTLLTHQIKFGTDFKRLCRWYSDRTKINILVL